MNDPDFRKKTLIRQVNPNRVIGRASTEVYPVDPPWLSDVLVYMRKHVGDRLTASATCSARASADRPSSPLTSPGSDYQRESLRTR